jgi:extradiol dioxygenase family protein
VLLFDLPKNEELMHKLIKAQNQKAAAQSEERNFLSLSKSDQHNMMLRHIGNRYKAHDWFTII